MWCPSCRGLGCSECRPASSLSALVGIVAEPLLCASGHNVRGWMVAGCADCQAIACRAEDCSCSMAWASPTPRPICPTHGVPEPTSDKVRAMYSSDRADLAAGRPLEMYRLAKEVAARCFQPPVYFGITPRADFEGLPAKWPSDTAWKRDTFPQETQ